MSYEVHPSFTGEKNRNKLLALIYPKDSIVCSKKQQNRYDSIGRIA